MQLDPSQRKIALHIRLLKEKEPDCQHQRGSVDENTKEAEAPYEKLLQEQSDKPWF